MLPKGIVAPLVVLSAIALSGCGYESPIAPSPPGPPSTVAPPATVDTWNISVRLAGISGGECVGETMKSQIGVPNSYTLSIGPAKDTRVDVTLRSTSGDYACAFPAIKAGDDGFTTFGVPGRMSCETSLVVRGFACTNGALRDMMRLGENISGRISGDQISGQWDVSWIIMEAGGDLGGRDDIAGLETTSQYTGVR